MDVNSFTKLLKDPNTKIIDMQLGLSNKNYLVTHFDESYVLRVPYEDSELIVDRHHEALAIKALENENIDVETLYFDEETGYKLTRYIENAYVYDAYVDEHKIEKVARLMKRFHALDIKIPAYFKPYERYLSYKQKETPFTFPYLDKILHYIQKQDTTSILCHNDWVNGNILFTQDKIYLIDYEYAAMNHPYFDVISFLSENEIDDLSLRKRFYEIYFDDFNEEIQTALHYWECFEDALWCEWAYGMYIRRKEEIYLQIAKAKNQHYHKVLQNIY